MFTCKFPQDADRMERRRGGILVSDGEVDDVTEGVDRSDDDVVGLKGVVFWASAA